MNNDNVLLKIFPIRNGKRGFKPEKQYKCTNLLEAQTYIYDNNVQLYDLSINGNVIDRDGNGRPGKYTKSESDSTIKYITVTNETKLFAALAEKTGVKPISYYPFRKGGSDFAASFANRNDANAFWKYVKHSADYAVLQVSPESYSLSFTVITNIFNEKQQCTPMELPQISTISSLAAQITAKLNCFTWDQLLETMK
jgi:hypothetical protein